MRVNVLPQQYWVVGGDPDSQSRYQRLTTLIEENPSDRVDVTLFEEVEPQPLRRKVGNLLGTVFVGGFIGLLIGRTQGLEGTALHLAMGAAATVTGSLGLSMVRSEDRPVVEERGRITHQPDGYVYQQRLEGLIPRYGVPYHLPESAGPS